MKIKKIYYTTNFAKKVAKFLYNLLKLASKSKLLSRSGKPKVHPESYQWFKDSGQARVTGLGIYSKFLAVDEVLFYDIGGHEVYK